MNKKMEKEELIRRSKLFGAIIQEIHNLYQENDGEPETIPPIECPMCNLESTAYGCVWNYNKHAYFFCPNCKVNMRQ
ncbi:hypothetical protein BCM02_1246 [Paenibacillus methanolicus]|uniref:Uncharacterized protein n=1 Tax=Paenibacillus methanolicus TaxID=582686 RepID=A0A5S5BLV3_9BACL|nr:hypothetical protein BCM02_1246 [Paenibacillus methanolicus]